MLLQAEYAKFLIEFVLIRTIVRVLVHTSMITSLHDELTTMREQSRLMRDMRIYSTLNEITCGHYTRMRIHQINRSALTTGTLYSVSQSQE